MTDPRTTVDNLRQRITDELDITDADRDLLMAFSDRLDLLASDYSDHRHAKLLGHVSRMARLVDVDGPVLEPALSDRKAAERIVAWINRTYDNEETNRDYRVALRVFGKRVADGDEVPDSMAWVSGQTSSTYDPSPDPRDMLEWGEDVVPMLEAATNPRDAAMVALGFDAGLRGGEFADLRVGDIQDHDLGLRVTVDGKQGRRSVLLVPSVHYVQAWIEVHPGADGTRAPLWSKLGVADEISHQRLYQVFDEVSDRAGITKPVTPTNLRKSSAAYLARRNLNQVHIEDHHGWVRGSRVAARYIATFGEATDREVARVHGVDIDPADETQPIGPIPCPRCGDGTPRERPFCVHCGQATDHEAHALVDEVLSVLDDALIDADDTGERADLVRARRGIAEQPGALKADELRHLASSLSD